MILILSLIFSVLCADDAPIKNIVSEQLKNEQEVILKNKIWLSHLETELKKYIKDGMVEKENCVRQNIATLRTIDYSYNWVLEGLKGLNTSEVRMNLIESLDRVKYLNKLFSDRTLKIEECNLKYTKNVVEPGNEMIKYNVGYKKDITRDLAIPEEYQGARAPFR
ncbi:MAG: hypothetical protein V1647_00725 [Pseudomonadota bacterium]